MKTNDPVMQTLAHLLTNLGVFKKFSWGDIEINLLGESCVCYFDVMDYKKSDDGFIVTVDIKLDLNDNGVIEDKILGFGPEFADAVMSAIDQFVGSIVAPIAALSSEIDLQKWRCHVTNFEIPGTGGDQCWNMVTGQIVSNDASGLLYTVADERPPLHIAMGPILTEIARVDNGKAHWIKGYLCRYPDMLDGEVRLDNNLNDEALRALCGFQWPCSQPMVWMRQFAILEPALTTERRLLKASTMRETFVQSQRKTFFQKIFRL